MARDPKAPWSYYAAGGTKRLIDPDLRISALREKGEIKACIHDILRAFANAQAIHEDQPILDVMNEWDLSICVMGRLISMHHKKEI